MREASNKFLNVLTALLVFLAGLGMASQPVWASIEPMASSEPQLVAMSDEELGGIAGGDLQMSLADFNVMVHDNQAGLFTMDIAQGAFDQAQGVFTTLQAVNSAVNMSVVVNIYLNGQSF